MSVGPVEAIWLALTLMGTVVTFLALVDALRDQQAIEHLNGDIRSIVARGNVRRESVRLVIQFAYLALLVLSGELFKPTEIRVTPFLAVLMALPALQLLNTSSDYIGRVKIARKLRADIVAARLRSQA